MLVNRGGYATLPRAPGHDRPRTALRAARHGRLSAAATAPGADVPLATTARAPGQYCLSAAHWAPGPGRPHALTAWPVVPDRLSATFLAPGPDAPRASTAPVSGPDRLRATRIATAPPPAGPHRRRQGSLPRVPATPNTLTYPHAHRAAAHTRTTHSRDLNRHAHRLNRHSRASGHPRPPGATGGPPGRYAPATGVAYTRTPRYAPAHFTIHHVQPALQVPPGPRCCSTATTGACRQHPSRAPPPPTTRHSGVGRNPLPLSIAWRWGGGRGVRPAAARHSRESMPLTPIRGGNLSCLSCASM